MACEDAPLPLAALDGLPGICETRASVQRSLHADLYPVRRSPTIAENPVASQGQSGGQPTQARRERLWLPAPRSQGMPTDLDQGNALRPSQEFLGAKHLWVGPSKTPSSRRLFVDLRHSTCAYLDRLVFRLEMPSPLRPLRLRSSCLFRELLRPICRSSARSSPHATENSSRKAWIA